MRASTRPDAMISAAVVVLAVSVGEVVIVVAVVIAAVQF